MKKKCNLSLKSIFFLISKFPNSQGNTFDPKQADKGNQQALWHFPVHFNWGNHEMSYMFIEFFSWGPDISYFIFFLILKFFFF